MSSEVATQVQSTPGEGSTGRLTLRGAPLDHDLRVTPMMESSGSVFGAEVEGVNWSEPLPQSTVDDLIALEDQYGVLIFRNTGLDNARHIRFASQLGKKLEVNPFYAGIENDRLQEPYLWDVGNIEKDGSLVKPDSRRWHHSLGNALWHTDSSYHQERSKYSLLLAHGEVGAGQSSTHFADTRRAYADLPEEKKKELEGLIVEHDLWHSRKLASPLVYAEPTAAERAKKPPAYHKLVQPAPNGDPTLYIAAHSKAIVGWSQEDSDRLIKELMDWCTQPQYVFTMDWVNSGDMVWWDNRASMHRANPYTVGMSARDVRRATVIDDGPYARGVSPVNEPLGI